jgi:hypothetical protein
MLSGDHPERDDATHDRRLELLTHRLAVAEHAGEVVATLEAIALELHADAIRVLTADGVLSHPEDGLARADPAAVPRSVRQTLAGDPAAAGQSMAPGYRSRLEVPIRCRSTLVGTLEAYALEERPWTRFEIRRGRIIANSMGSALAHVGGVLRP